VKPVCLIIPPSIFLLDERVFISLGILKVAAYLEKVGRPVEMVDLSGISNFEEAISDHAAASHAEYFGVTATTPQMPAASKVIAAIKAANPNAKTILGGPHITLVNAARKREAKLGINGRAHRAMAVLHEMFDILVAGDGELAIVNALENPRPLVDADDPKSSLFLTDDSLTDLPWPARHLIDVDSYNYTIEGEKSTSVIFQLGCPYLCGFCGGRESPMLRRIRTRSTENAVAEILHLHKTYGCLGFMCSDDELNVNKEMLPLMRSLADAQKQLGVEFKMRGFIKSQLFTDEQAESMRAAGFKWILVGFESGSERILTNINKRATRAENTRCMEIARRHDLKVKALMSIGHPGESESTILDTREWLMEVKPADFDVTIITTYPGTPYFDHALETLPGIWTYTYPQNGDRLHAYEIDFNKTADFYKGRVGDYQSYVYTDYLDASDLVILRDKTEVDVREQLGIPFNQSAASVRYDHSMGASQLPPFILKQTHASAPS